MTSTSSGDSGSPDAAFPPSGAPTSAAAGMLGLSSSRPAPLAHLERIAARVVHATNARIVLTGQAALRLPGVALPRVSGIVAPASVLDALCSLTAELGETLRVDDVARDPRTLTVDSSGAIDEPVGAFLGIPLRLAGSVVGAVGVVDSIARPWTDDEAATVEALVDPVLTELQMASLAADYEDERIIWQLAVDAAGVGAFDWNLATGELRWDERLLELFGLDERSFGGTIEAFNAAVHPDDRERVTAALQGAIDVCGLFVSEYRIVRPTGEERWISARGRAVAGSDGTASRVLGAASDSTAVRDEDARVARVLEAMPTAFFHLDTTWRFTYANTEARRLLGGIGRDVIGEVIWELFPAALETEFERRYRDAVHRQQPVAFEAYYPPPLDAWYEVRAWPTPDGLSVYFIDISEQRLAQQAIERADRRATVLAEVTEALTGTLDVDEAVSRLAHLLVPALGDWCVVTRVDGVDDARVGELGPDWRRRLRDIGWWHADPGSRPLVEGYARTRVPALRDSSYVARVLEEGRLVALTDGASARVADALDPGIARDIFLTLAPDAAAVVPLRARGRTVGIVTIFRGHERGSFSGEELATLEEAAGRAGLALDNARLYSEQRDLAETLQLSMMTDPPQPDHLQIAVRYASAAEVAQVGGDWYDAFMQPEGATVVVIGDVVGHDTAAVAAMGQLRNLLRGIAVTTGEGPAEILARVDQAMATLVVDTTATAVVARIEATPEERRAGVTRLRWSNAGHPPPLIASPPALGAETPGATSKIRVLWGSAPNLLLGIAPDALRDESEVTMERGATVLLYTDGLVERRGQLIDDGIELLASVFTELVDRGLDLDPLCDELLRRMLPERPEDDVAVVAVRLHREDGPRPAAAGPEKVPAAVRNR